MISLSFKIVVTMSRLHQDQHTKETGWAWTNENPLVVGSHSPDFQGLRRLSGGPGTHIEVRFTLNFFGL